MSPQKLYADWSGNVVADATVRGLDPEAIRVARASYASRYPDSVGELSSWDDTEFLNRAHVFKRGRVTNAALILLGKGGSERMLPGGIGIRWRLIDTSGTVVDTRVFDGPMILTARNAVSMIRNPACRIGTGDRVRDVGTYRTSTLLEAVYNSIAHQDYSSGGMVDIIEREGESVTVMNRGAFPNNSPESFVTGRPQTGSRTNPFLFGAMSGIGLVSGVQAGIRGMYLSQAYRHFPMPRYSFTDDTVVLTIPGIRSGEYVRVLDSRDDLDISVLMDLNSISCGRFVPERRLIQLERRGLISIDGGVVSITSDSGTMSMFTRGTDRDAVMEMISELGSVNRADVAAMLSARDPKGLSDEQMSVKATNLLQSMRREGLIVKAEGSTKSARYLARENRE